MSEKQIETIKKQLINLYNRLFKKTSDFLKKSKANEDDIELILSILDNYFKNISIYTNKIMEENK